MSRARQHVALLVETSLGSGREILRGIARYAHQTEGWQLFHSARGLDEALPEWLEGWDGHGVIARVQSERMADVLEQLSVPVVDVLGVVPGRGFPLVHVDDAGIARLAMEHFQGRGFAHYGFFGIAGENWSERRRDAMEKRVGKGKTFSVLEMPRNVDGQVRGQLERWLRDLPKPVGVMVSSDQRGLLLLEACRSAGVAVPEEVAVVGVDNDVPLCEVASPALSSIRGGHFRVGFEAGAVLSRLMEGGAAAMPPRFIEPTGLVVRASSDIQAIADPVVARGVRFIRENLKEPVSNEDVARASGLSRTMFQQRFRRETGQTIRSYLLDQRVRRALELIERSDLTLADIAEQAGFRHQEYLGAVFRRRLGQTPGQWRAARRRGAEDV